LPKKFGKQGRKEEEWDVTRNSQKQATETNRTDTFFFTFFSENNLVIFFAAMGEIIKEKDTVRNSKKEM
jgi:hypothetical protein